MFWKNWPYWLKGGLIAVLVAFVLMIALIPFGAMPCLSCDISIPLPYWAVIPFLIVLISRYKIGILTDSIPLAVASSFLIYFLIGTIIGIVIGRIKKLF